MAQHNCIFAIVHQMHSEPSFAARKFYGATRLKAQQPFRGSISEPKPLIYNRYVRLGSSQRGAARGCEPTANKIPDFPAVTARLR